MRKLPQVSQRLHPAAHLRVRQFNRSERIFLMFRPQAILTFVVFKMVLQNMGDLECGLFNGDDGVIGALLRMGRPLNQIQRAGDLGEGFAADMQIDHSGGQPAVAH